MYIKNNIGYQKDYGLQLGGFGILLVIRQFEYKNVVYYDDRQRQDTTISYRTTRHSFGDSHTGRHNT